MAAAAQENPAGAGRPPAPGRAAMRRTMFLAQDGVTLCMTLRGLDAVGLLEPALAEERTLAELAPGLGESGLGAVAVALHGLVATGWLAERPTLDPATTVLRWTAAGREAMAWRSRYIELGDLLACFDDTEPGCWAAAWSAEAERRFATLVERAGEHRGGRGRTAELLAAHLDGALAVPTLLSLHGQERLGGAGPLPPPAPLGAAIGRLLADLGWVDRAGAWTEAGLQARSFALHFGGVATYLPLLARLPELYTGRRTVVPEPAAGRAEWHVNRSLNVRISAAAHKRYFADSDPLFIEIFNREPIAEQPRFIADMGCGQGSWLAHLHRLVRDRTARGARLEDHPLTMVGVDPDPIAREEARQYLAREAVPALLLPGDVTDPEGLAAALAEHGLRIEEGLHIRSFIDHERSFRGGAPEAGVAGWASGVYLDADGGRLAAAAVERDLVAHLERWAALVPRHGMVVLEAHCTPPEIVARHLGEMHGLAFDAHQAYSKQYPVDHPSFLACCRRAGLRPVGPAEIRYPQMRPFVSISLNHLVPAAPDPLPEPVAGEPAGTWRPDPGADLEDGRALHGIVFDRGDVRFPADWCLAPTGFVVARALEQLESRLAAAADGGVVRVLDYGAGTGTATIELMRACEERGLRQRFTARGERLEFHLVDIPSSWYAYGYELLAGRPGVRFHSLLDGAGRFRPLDRVLGAATIDVAVANMVFHLIPPRALGRTAAGLASVLTADGLLAWSAPDLGPAAPGTLLLHDPNRMLRERWLALLAGEPAPSPTLRTAVASALRDLDAERRGRARDRAERRIRPRPLASEVTAALAARFTGTTRLASYAMLADDVVRGLLVPSNQAEFISELDDPELRGAVIRELMREHVLPALGRGPAATGLGLNLQWTLGAHRPIGSGGPA
ncbi:MAG: class I SAM-dependent methyltransferase [Solirubrobacterales bacterium]